MSNDKQRQFALEYLIDGDGKAAAIRAGYSKKSAKYIACRNLKNSIIKAFHGKFIREQIERMEIDAGEAIRQLYFALTRQAKDFTDENGAILPPHELPPHCQSIIDGYEVDVLRIKTTVDGETTITEEVVKMKYKLTPHASARPNKA